LLEVTSDQGVFVFEPDPGKEKLKANTRVNDGVNGPVRIHTSGSRPLNIGDVFGAYTVTNLIKIYHDDPNTTGGIDVKGTFNPALPFDPNADDVTFVIDDGQGHILTFHIPAGSFTPEGRPEDQKFKFDTPKGSVTDIKAKFDVLKCTFDLKVKKHSGTTDVTGPNITVILQAGPNLAQETVQVQAKGKHKDRLEHRKTPKLKCCPK